MRNFIDAVRHLCSLVETANPPIALDAPQMARLRSAGFDVDELLYHGSDKEFTALDRRFSKTAAHIYTSPDRNTASGYGSHLYVCVGRQDPQADLIDDHVLLGKLSDTFADEFADAVESDERLTELRSTLTQEHAARLQAEDPTLDAVDLEYDSKDAAEADPRFVALRHKVQKEFAYEVLTGGEIYGYDVKGFLQDSVMSECFGLGYKSVRFPDNSTYGQPISVVFNDGADVVIVGKLPDPADRYP